jgi:hypothetical protein
VTTPAARGLTAASLLALAAAVSLQAGRDAAYPPRDRPSERLLYTRSGEAIKRIALEFDALAADVYWIRAIQHYGSARLDPQGRGHYELLQPLLDLTTTLDPYFTIAYRFGAIFLSEAPPGGPGRPDQAIALLEKGIAAQPEKWQYFHDIAFVHYWHLHDPAAAATWFQRAARQPGAPNWLMPLAATMLTAGDRSSARILWQQILESNEAWLKRIAERRLLQLEALDEIDELQAIVVRAAVSGGHPLSWSDLAARGLLPGTPLDPTGVPYLLDPDDRRVMVSPSSTLNPMPDLSRRLQ